MNANISFIRVELPSGTSETRMRLIYGDLPKIERMEYFLFQDDQVVTTAELAKELEDVLKKIFPRDTNGQPK